jgi:type IV secretion system protein VirB1
MILPDFTTLALQCVPGVAPATMTAIVRTESALNPLAIGVVGGRLLHQPSSINEAIATVRALDAGHWNYSVGLAQVNRANWPRLGLNVQDAFDPCRNLAAAGAILQGCFQLARAGQADVQRALRQSLSCYSSGDFVTGYRTGYVQRVVNNVRDDAMDHTADPASVRLLPTVPAIAPNVLPIAVVPTDSNDPPAQPYRRTTEHGQSGTHPASPIDAQPAERDEKPDNSAVVF